MKQLILVLSILFSVITNSFAQNTSVTNQQEKLQLTQYSDRFEVFAEATPFSVNTESSILAHFTYLSNFKPLKEGEVTLSMEVDGKIVTQKLSAPTKVGIYKFNIIPQKAGAGTLTFEIKTKDGVEKVLLSPITIFSDKRQAQLDANNKFIHHPKGITFYKEKSWYVDFSTAQIKTNDAESFIVPRQSVIKQNEKQYILIQLHPELFIKQEIKATQWNERAYLISDGLKKGDRYVNKGVVYLLKNKQK